MPWQGLIAASDLYGEGYVDMDEFLAAMVANSNYSKTKDAVRAAATSHAARGGRSMPGHVVTCAAADLASWVVGLTYAAAARAFCCVPLSPLRASLVCLPQLRRSFDALDQVRPPWCPATACTMRTRLAQWQHLQHQ